MKTPKIEPWQPDAVVDAYRESGRMIPVQMVQYLPWKDSARVMLVNTHFITNLAIRRIMSTLPYIPDATDIEDKP